MAAGRCRGERTSRAGTGSDGRADYTRRDRLRANLGTMIAPMQEALAEPLAPSDPPDHLAAFARAHPRLLVLTGAGCSVASGIPEYRDHEGAWKSRPPATRSSSPARPRDGGTGGEAWWAGSASPPPGPRACIGRWRRSSARGAWPPWSRRTWTRCTSARAAGRWWTCTAAWTAWNAW